MISNRQRSDILKKYYEYISKKRFFKKMIGVKRYIRYKKHCVYVWCKSCRRIGG